jgi:hypothetical protein
VTAMGANPAESNLDGADVHTVVDPNRIHLSSPA